MRQVVAECLASAQRCRARSTPSVPQTYITSLVPSFRLVPQATPDTSTTLVAPDGSLRSLSREAPRLRRSAAGIGRLGELGRSSVALPLRRSSARRRAQRALMMGVLPQNGARHEQWCTAVLASAGASHRGNRQRAEV